MHFNLLRSSYPTVPLYADGYELLASGAFLTSVSVPKNKFFDTLKTPCRYSAGRFYAKSGSADRVCGVYAYFFRINSTPSVPGPQWQDTVQPAFVS